MFEMTCRTCGRPFVPDYADDVAAPAVYRLCPDCRPVATDAVERPAVDPEVPA